MTETPAQPAVTQPAVPRPAVHESAVPRPAVNQPEVTQPAVNGPAVIRRATAADVAGIVRMIADDQLGATRESVDDLTPYLQAFEAIDADPNQVLVVAERNDELIGTLQLTIIPGLSRQGSSRGLVEAVRVAASARGSGLGTTLMEWAVEESRTRGCTLVQLTSDKTRTDAHRFYERLGFTNSHEGFKLKLN